MPCAIENTRFTGTEVLRYEVFYNLNFVWIPAGDVTFTVQETDSTYIYDVIGKTYPSYEWFYKVYDTFHAEVDKNTLLPLRAARSVEEGGFTKNETVTFYQESEYAESDLTRKGEHKGIKKVSIDQCVQDILSALYYFRNQKVSELKKSEDIPFSIYLDQEIYNTSIRFCGEKKKKIKGLGKCKTYMIQPTVIAGEVFKEGDEMKVYVSADDNLLPLMVESPVVVGSVKAVLREYKDLKYPLQL